MIGFRQSDPRFPFLWEEPDQPSARWHEAGEGPVQYFSDTPEAAWGEFLRHEEIVDPVDVFGIRRAMWVIMIEDERLERSRLPDRTLRGGPATYPDCRDEARKLREAGADGVLATSAALEPGTGVRFRVDGGLVKEPWDDPLTIALFGPRPSLTGWLASPAARPSEDLVGSVRYYPGTI